MKKFLLLALSACYAIGPLFAQTHCYWVRLTDKEGASFDPYTYFDAKAIERYQQCGADLYDISNYPVVPAYEQAVAEIAEESLGTSRWLNAVAVCATLEQVARMEELPFVEEVVMVGGPWQLAEHVERQESEESLAVSAAQLTDQLVRMGGQLFKERGIDGRGVRIAVFDSGFPHVNTHMAFKHLRDSGQIVKTWNFPDKKEDVYLAGSHGTMTLSCIAGCLNGKQIGLATGAEFLLARTEINPEPFKEEVWWMQAMEWADRNGAQIISSSLGYGKERHYTYEMDGRSYVARAANMAARKGMLVCNSAGNEGDDSRWKTIITPADADSVLCVAGIQDRLDAYRHISFSSFGPAADGRRKPNVCAFGHALVAKHSNDTLLTDAYGTSFSCPLVSGFAACAWQTRPGATAMQMMQAIEQSADLYPYYDYAFGYGVPQASHFVGEGAKTEPTFQFEDRGFFVALRPTQAPAMPQAKLGDSPAQREPAKANIFIKAHDQQGRLEKYYSLEFDRLNGDEMVVFRKEALCNRTLVAHYAGYTDSLRLSDQENRRLSDQGMRAPFEYAVVDTSLYYSYQHKELLERTPDDNKVNEKPLAFQFAALYGPFLDEVEPYNDQFQMAFRLVKPVRKRYLLGGAFNVSFNTFRFPPLDGEPSVAAEEPSVLVAGADKISLRQNGIGLEFFQRVVLSPGGQVTHQGLHWDLGLTFDWFCSSRLAIVRHPNALAQEVATLYRHPSQIDHRSVPTLAVGATTRLTYDWIGLFASWRMRLSGGEESFRLPAFSAGVQLNL